jgi:hypothetical protein
MVSMSIMHLQMIGGPSHGQMIGVENPPPSALNVLTLSDLIATYRYQAFDSRVGSVHVGAYVFCGLTTDTACEMFDEFLNPWRPVVTRHGIPMGRAGNPMEG